ncbi:phosphate/phosphite/phosphonate ABC transporter substrate-binding protein [Pontibacterium granulatum]|uniref:phosphate/phosphite/phosphonate ABC transporter substrate-binding protein n=1 Tax=Pontibacterium granulatum TaxID=2036029 RepID=UPI00249B4BDF|nr:phosphate/phosphite/phosphonate ABC transporter substrate-binding protein [Pontibacterium granulatum]MDI3324316.1 phosphate/phosphite/phosphonate ABC transporter substrate-binding protein [Pontibacterium granulatum]
MLYRRRMRNLIRMICLSTLLVTAHAAAETLVLAQLSDRPKKDFKQLRPMAKYVAQHLGHVGITRAEVRLFSELDELIEAVKKGEVHWVTETPYSAAVLVHEADAIPLLMKWKSRQQRYQTLIYTHKDSGLRNLADLTGKRIAFEHNNSFSSYYLPRMILEKHGQSLNFIHSLHAARDSNKVNHLFSRNEKNNLLWVHKRLVEAGALNDGDWQNPDRVPDALKSELRIIYRSEPYPRALELVSSKLSAERAAALKALLLGMTSDSHGKLLSRYEQTSGFETLNEDVPKLLAEIYNNSRNWSE